MKVNIHISCDVYGVEVPHYVYVLIEKLYCLTFFNVDVSQLMNVITVLLKFVLTVISQLKTKIYMGSQIILYQMFEYDFDINELLICKSPLTPF